MKFKMAKNSLFAVLMRKPWWLSVLIAAALALLAAALLPEKYKIVGALSVTLPLLVVAVLSVKRQWGLPSEAQQAQAVQALSTMAWPAFADLLEAGFKRDGYEVTRTKPAQAAAVDFELTRQGRQTLVSARRWKSARVGLESLRSVQAAVASSEASDAILICLGELTDNARPYAAEHLIKVWQSVELAQLLKGLLPRASRAV